METVQVNIVTFALDDNEDELELMRKAFTRAGLTHFELFSNESDFWKNYRDDVHIAVLDYDIKPKTGLDIAERLLEINPYCRIIIYSGVKDADVAIRALNMGVFQWIGKAEPSSMEKTIEWIVRAKEWMTPFIALKYNKKSVE